MTETNLDLAELKERWGKIKRYGELRKAILEPIDEAVQAINNGDYEAAEKILSGLLNKYPREMLGKKLDGQLLWYKGEALLGLEKYKDALKCFDDGEKKCPEIINAPKNAYKKGESCAKVGKYKQAVAYFDRELARLSKEKEFFFETQVLHSKADALAKLKQYENALKVLEIIIDKEDDLLAKVKKAETLAILSEKRVSKRKGEELRAKAKELFSETAKIARQTKKEDIFKRAVEGLKKPH